MKKLKLESSCEIDNLIDVFVERLGKPYEEVEKMAAKEGLFPEGKKVFVTTQFGKDEDDEDGTLRGALFDYMVEEKIESMYITYPI